MLERYEPGAVVVYRDVQRGRTLWDAPHLVVADDDQLIALYIAPGVEGRRPADGLSERYAQRMLGGDWELSPWVWRWNHVLRLMRPGSAHAVELYWDAETWQFRGWYVNLQDPVRRTPEGFETTDHVLDIVIDPSGTWQWKDEDKLTTLVDVGYYGDIDVRRIRAEGLRVVEQIERWATPFCDGWESWRPSHIQQTPH